jgi:hypothetical protein
MAVCNLIQSLDDIDIFVNGQNFPSISEWWDKLIERKLRKEQRATNSCLLYVA